MTDAEIIERLAAIYRKADEIMAMCSILRKRITQKPRQKKEPKK